MIAYKVVGKKTRLSSNFTIFQNDKGSKKLEKLLENKEIAKFCKKYEPGKIVRAVRGSVGILCFSDMDSAEVFISRQVKPKNFKVIQVSGNKRRLIKGFSLINNCGGLPERLTHINIRNAEMRPPWGTIAFPQVKVLD